MNHILNKINQKGKRSFYFFLHFFLRDYIIKKRGNRMIIKEFNKPLYHEKYYYRDHALTVENHYFGIFAWYESEYEEGYIHNSPDWNSPFYSVFIVTEGLFENMDIYGNMVTMTPGSVMLADHPAGYMARSVNEPARRKCFHLYKTAFTRKLISCFFPEGFVRLDLQDPVKGERLFDRIKEEYCRKEAGSDSSALLGLVMELPEHIRKRPKAIRQDRYRFSNFTSFWEGAGSKIMSKSCKIRIADEIDQYPTLGRLNNV